MRERPMKIAMVLDDSIDRPDGVQQYVLTIGAYMRSQGHEVHYVCSDATRTDVTVHSLARNVKVTFNGNDLRIPLPTSRALITAFLTRENYDVIHVQMPHSPLFGARVVAAARAVNPRVRIVGTFHILPDSRLSAAATRLLGRVLRRNTRLFDARCAVSQPAADFAHTTFGGHWDVVPNAVNIAAFAGTRPRPAPEGRRLVVAFLGRLVPRKGAAELLQALWLLRPEVRDLVEVRIGGRGPLERELRADITQRGLEDTVTLAGFISEDDKPQFYADADIAVFPATGGESFGIVLIEAMASGAGVVLGGDNPGYRSVLERDDALADPKDALAFSHLLERVFTDASVRDRIAADQRERVKRFDAATVGERVLALYGG